MKYLSPPAVPDLSADPSGQVVGALYRNSGSGRLRLYDGTAWGDVLSLVGGVAINVSGSTGALTVDNDGALGALTGGTSKLTASSTVNATTSPLDTGLVITVTLVSGRRYKLTFDGMVASSVANDRATVQFIDTVSGVLKTAQTFALSTASSAFAVHMERILDCTADIPSGSRSFKVQIQRMSGSGSINITAAAGTPAQFWIEDIGPTTGN